MSHHIALVVWRVPGNPHPLTHVGEADTALDAVAAGHGWAQRAQLGDYNVVYVGWISDDKNLYVRPTQDYSQRPAVPYTSGPQWADRLHERLIERGDDDGRGDDHPDDWHDG